MVEITDKHNCCGCEACVQACPKHCISFDEDAEGFRYPLADKTACIGCGLCEKVCPVLNQAGEREPLKVYAAVNPDEKIRSQSSSGGIFTMLAEKVIDMGGVVFGVRFDEHWQAVFDYTEAAEGLSVFRGSKYIQARVGDAYSRAKGFLKEGRFVMFSASPCQIVALRHYLKKDYDNLLCVDFVCHGVPSPKVWRKYLSEITRNARHAIQDVRFRNKKQGWKRFNFDMTYNKDFSQFRISSYHRKNHFMRIFLNDVILRPSCYSCKAKRGRSGSDVTMADFWGIGKINPQMDDDKGTSLVLLNTSKGENFIEGIAVNLWEAPYEDALKHNRAIEHSAIEHPKRTSFFTLLDSSDSVITLIDDTLRLPLILRVKRYLRLLPGRIIRTVRAVAGGGVICVFVRGSDIIEVRKLYGRKTLLFTL